MAQHLPAEAAEAVVAVGVVEVVAAEVAKDGGTLHGEPSASDKYRAR